MFSFSLLSVVCLTLIGPRDGKNIFLTLIGRIDVEVVSSSLIGPLEVFDSGWCDRKSVDFAQVEILKVSIHPSPFVEVPFHLLIAWGLSWKTSLGYQTKIRT